MAATTGISRHRVDELIAITGLTEVARIASTHGITLPELAARMASPDAAFMDFTRDDVEYKATPAAQGAGCLS